MRQSKKSKGERGQPWRTPLRNVKDLWVPYGLPIMVVVHVELADGVDNGRRDAQGVKNDEQKIVIQGGEGCGKVKEKGYRIRVLGRVSDKVELSNCDGLEDGFVLESPLGVVDKGEHGLTEFVVDGGGEDFGDGVAE